MRTGGHSEKGFLRMKMPLLSFPRSAFLSSPPHFTFIHLKPPAPPPPRHALPLRFTYLSPFAVLIQMPFPLPPLFLKSSGLSVDRQLGRAKGLRNGWRDLRGRETEEARLLILFVTRYAHSLFPGLPGGVCCWATEGCIC